MCARRAEAAALAVLLAFAPPAAALDLTEAERAAFGAEVRALLLDEPEIVGQALSPGPSYAEEAAKDAALLDELAADLYRDPADFAEGPEDGTPLVAFLPPACDSCPDLLEDLRALAQANAATRLIVKDFPASPQVDPQAARFLTAVLKDLGPAYWKEARTALSGLPDPSNPEALRRVSEVMGWPADDLIARMAAPDVEARLGRMRGLAEALGFDVFPSYVVGGTMIRGDVPPALLGRYLP
jgi:protein-disulfide isomerase